VVFCPEKLKESLSLKSELDKIKGKPKDFYDH
jgi:hypothetical protein